MNAPVRTRALAALALLLAPLAGCGSTGGAGAEGRPTTLTVLAAASLTESFTVLGSDFETTHPGVTVRFSFGASSALAQQVVAGAPADVLATASASTMRTVTDAGDATGAPTTFATNSLVLITPVANPAAVTGLADLARPGLKLALCAPTVPCGALALTVLADAGVKAVPVTQEEDVKAVVTKVVLGEADAGLVYRTDATAAAGRLSVVPTPGIEKQTTSYPVAVLAGARQPALAAEFVALLTSSMGRGVLASQGFTTP